MKFPLSCITGLLLACSIAVSQPKEASTGPFPQIGEFPEIEKLLTSQSFEDPSALPKIDNGQLISDVGFSRLSYRVYLAGQAGKLSITIATLIDFRAAYSLLTLLRTTALHPGPPGDAYATAPGSLMFFQGRSWIRIAGPGASEDLMRRVALSISNRLGSGSQKPPSLISHFPKPGYEDSGLRYFPGVKAFETFSSSETLKSLNIQTDAEIAQARYALNGQSGTMFLLNFPTSEVADEYFAEFSAKEPYKANANKRYAKKAGPIVAILEGHFDSATADKILSTLSYSYSVRWIYEKGKKSKAAWGVPVSILQTVVKSILFVALLCVIAIITGAASALLRLVFRGGLSKDAPPERTDITRLRLR